MAVPTSAQVSRKITRSSSKPVIAVVIPAYRTEKYILKVLSSIPAFVTFIVVVDDCSPDNLANLVLNCTDSRVHLVRHKINQGVGGATLTGYTKAAELGADVIVKIDSDDQMDTEYILPIVVPIIEGEADYVKGNRFLHVTELRQMPITRRLGNIGLSFLVKAASGYWSIFDPTNGYTAIHSSIVPLLNKERVHKRYFFESSMLIELGIIGAVVKDVYIPSRYQGEPSSLSEIEAFLKFPPLLLVGFLRRLWLQYFVRDFGVFSVLLLLGLALTTFGAVFGLYNWYISIVTSVASSTGTVMLAVLPFVIGSQLLIQALIVDVHNTPVKPLHRENAALQEWIEIFNS